ncbi:branched-chain amino acid ABC transporter permease [Siminovitchia fortis]|uniref:Branched-chain amino acid ABC transporter permease n=1 Tax=Siminovitchia fortis TaxID=254758 RepID=A0A443IZR7_9BACI|nr:branched-chain amino acid ABC transporter permease [Siminovitchia fortis]RWR13643.1 branched-chain amino acid ABC transporter permease [Siminovitchia fortis]WHY81896.1 branched-chain amino acid ABC transporter permease [Siminovitchia fortis]
MSVLKKRTAVLTVLLLAALAFPFMTNNYWIDVATLALLYIIMAQGLNVVAGYAGLLDLGYAAFFAIGAYTTGILMTAYEWPFLMTLPVAALFSAISGAIIGAPSLRLRSDYLAVVTLGFGEIIRITATNLEITGTATGIFGIPSPNIGGYELKSQLDFYIVILILAVITIFVTARLGRSRIGRAWTYIREDEDAAEAMGVDRVRMKLLAFVIGAIIGGLAGSFFAVKMGAVAPHSFKVLQSIMILLAVVLGGIGSVTGVTIGAILVIVLPEFLRNVSDWRYLVFGLLMIIMMLFRPQGLWPAKYETEPESDEPPSPPITGDHSDLDVKSQ